MDLQLNMPRSIQKLRQRSLVLEVRDELERMILQGELGAGERLNEIGLAEKLGVSRGPVREAARSLEREGLVMAVANQGVYVRKLTVEDIVELYDLRASIGGYLCTRAAQSATPEEKAELRTFVGRMADAIRENDEARYFELNLDFHDRIAAVSGANRSKELYTSLGKEVRLLRLRVLTGKTSMELSNREHEDIVAAIERGDGVMAGEKGSQHHISGKNRLMEIL